MQYYKIIMNDANYFTKKPTEKIITFPADFYYYIFFQQHS